MKKLMLLIILILIPCETFALEKEYQAQWCREHNGEMEYRLADQTRVDCVTDDYAVEVEYAHKWAEAIGQALYYAEQTGKKPGIVLIIERREDNRFLERLKVVADKHKIAVWTMEGR